MNKLLGEYKNNNYNVRIYIDGTKIRKTEEDEFIPEFPESMDVCISTLCNNNCSMCYANCSPTGYNADFTKYTTFLDSIHPYTEMAININSVWHPGLVPFLKYMRDRDVVVNATINQKDFEKWFEKIEELTNENLIWGLGISLTNPTKDFLDKVKKFPNAVIHIINGIVTPEHIKKMSDNNLKLLILGYKQVGRGVEYYKNVSDEIKFRQRWIDDNLEIMSHHFNIISFDNLAFEQLNVKKLLTEEQYEERYLGDDGLFSFYVNLVDGTFSRNSLSDEHYPIGNQTVTQCFDYIRKNELKAH